MPHLTDEQWQRDLDELLDVEEGLTSYEEAFIHSMASQLRRYSNFNPTDEQVTQLADIARRVL